MVRLAVWFSGLCVLVAGVVAAPAAWADAMRVPGTTVALHPPTGFTASKRFPGFEHPQLGASIMVNELPAPFAEMRAGLTKERLATGGMELVESSEVTLSGTRALLLQVRQAVPGQEYLKWMLVADRGPGSVLVLGTFPKSAASSLSTQMRTAVLSTSFHQQATDDVWQGLPFKVTPSAKLKLAGRTGNMLVLTRSGTPGPLKPEEPLYVAGNSHAEIAVADLRSFAEGRVAKTAQTRDVRNLSGRNVDVDGLQAYEIVADASDLETGKPIRLYQTIAVDGRGYFIFQGLVGPDSAPEYVEEFRRITASFKRQGAAGPGSAAHAPSP